MSDLLNDPNFKLLFENMIPLFKMFGVVNSAIGAVIGLILGSLLTYLFNVRRDRKKSRVDVAFNVASQFDSIYPLLDEAYCILNKPSLREENFIDINKVLRMGNWFEIVITLYNQNYADKPLLEKAGLIELAKKYATRISQTRQFERYLESGWSNLKDLIKK